MIFLISSFVLCFFVLALVRLDWALLFLIIALPSYLVRFQVFGIPSTLLEAMILISFLVWSIKTFIPHIRSWLKNRKKRIPYPFSREIIILLIISLISVGVSHFSFSALGVWKAYFFEPIVVFILILNVFKKKKDWQKIFWALLVSAGLVSIGAIFQKITGQYIFNDFWSQADARRVVSWFGYPNAVGLYLAPLTMLFIGWFFWLPKRADLGESLKKLLLIVITTASILSICFARSEGALLGVVAGLGVFGVLAGRRQRMVTISIAAVIILGLMIYPPTKNYTLNKVTLSDLSGEIRQQQWKETWEMLRDGRILSGAGLNNYQNAITPYHQEGIFFNRDNMTDFDSQLYGNAELRAIYWQPVEIYLYPHNILLNFWSELGLLGALLFVWLMVKYLFIANKLNRALGKEGGADRYIALGLLSAMIAIIVHGLVDVPYFKNDLAIIFWVLLAILGSLNIHHRQLNK